MRCVIQRVSEASVTIDTTVHSQIGPGLLLLVGVEERDDADHAEWLAGKVARMRLFGDEGGQMNLSVTEIHGEVLVVSQFTLWASTKKGNRPSFIRAARPEQAAPLVDEFCRQLSILLPSPVKTGVFGADMKVRLLNDGPVTILMDTHERE